MKRLLYRVGAALFTALAIVGMGTITGYPAPLWRQVVAALLSATAVQVYIEYRYRKHRRGK